MPHLRSNLILSGTFSFDSRSYRNTKPEYWFDVPAVSQMVSVVDTLFGQERAERHNDHKLTAKVGTSLRMTLRPFYEIQYRIVHSQSSKCSIFFFFNLSNQSSLPIYSMTYKTLTLFKSSLWFKALNLFEIKTEAKLQFLETIYFKQRQVETNLMNILN